MPKVEGTYPHEMELEQAINVVKNAVEELLDSFEATDTNVVQRPCPDPDAKSMEFSCKSRGFSISGKATIRKDDIHVIVNLPMLAMAFKGLVKAGMDKQIPKYLE